MNLSLPEKSPVQPCNKFTIYCFVIVVYTTELCTVLSKKVRVEDTGTGVPPCAISKVGSDTIYRD